MNVQEILFGWDPTDHIVAVEPKQDTVTVYRRTDFGVVSEIDDFRPWILTDEKQPLRDASWQKLDGESGYNWLAVFPDWQAFYIAREQLRENKASHLAYISPAKQYLMSSGRTLFKDMPFEKLHRIQLDIETLGFSPNPKENAIILISLTDNKGLERLLFGDEADILCELVDLIQRLDPDIIEGHNIFGFDLPYIAKRAELHGIGLNLGRDKSPVVFSAERSVAIGGYSRPFMPAHIYGRHILDTLFGVQRYDVGRSEMSSYGLKEVAAQLGLSEPERVILPKEEIGTIWKKDPELVKTYCLQDAKETRSLSSLVFPPDFYLTQMVPDTLQNVTTSGNGEKIDSMLIREYVRRRVAIPKPEPPRSVTGGYTEIKATGVIKNVVKCDVESLYPSIMLSMDIKPKSDTLGVFLPMLRELTNRRLNAKSRVKSTVGKESAYWEGMQQAFKVLINSFYGYLGAPLHFNDFDAAEKITLTGQEIVKKIVDELERTGSLVIEIDTDGVYFKPYREMASIEEEIAYIDEIAKVLPSGIRLAHDGRYQAMISLKVKNYVLAGYDGTKIFKGAAVRSRADEPFGKEFISKVVDCLITDDKKRAAKIYSDIASQIEKREMPVERFARRERITEKTFTSTAKKRSAEAAKGAKIGDYILVYQKNDGSLGLAENYANDEDTWYLLDKLYKFALRLREAFGDEFDELFPKPTKKSRLESAGQQTLF